MTATICNRKFIQYLGFFKLSLTSILDCNMVILNWVSHYFKWLCMQLVTLKSSNSSEICNVSPVHNISNRTEFLSPQKKHRFDLGSVGFRSSPTKKNLDFFFLLLLCVCSLLSALCSTRNKTVSLCWKNGETRRLHAISISKFLFRAYHGFVRIATFLPSLQHQLKIQYSCSDFRTQKLQ